MKSVSVLAIVAVGCYKIFETNLNITVDFPTLLSLLLGFFSVWLAALFYFKATDSSNAFYDNTNKFTANISQLLAKIESGFGERLKNIEGNNQEVRDFMFKSKREISDEMVETEEAVQEAQSEFSKVMEERNKLLDELIEKANLTEDENSIFKEKLKERESELALMNEKMSGYEKRVSYLQDKLKESERVAIGHFNHIKNKKNVLGITTLGENSERPKIRDMINVVKYIQEFDSLNNFLDICELGVVPDDVMSSMINLGYMSLSGEISELGVDYVRKCIESRGESG